MKKPRSVGEKKVEAKKQLPEQTVQNLAKSVGKQDRYSCRAVPPSPLPSCSSAFSPSFLQFWHGTLTSGPFVDMLSVQLQR
ncbi:hypothetical protein STEG23_000749 [Scotinomys teguina]